MSQNMTLTCEPNKEDKIQKLNQKIKALTDEDLIKLERWVESRGKKVFSVKQAADFLEVCPDSVRKAIRTKRLKAVQINRMGAWRIPREELERFMGGE